MLWIDGVGGFLVVAGNEWLIGGPSAGSSVEINVHGDLSRRAAAIRRQGSDYVLQPLAPTWMSDQPLDRPSLLRDGATFQLGNAVRFRFGQTHRLSSSARLDLVSRHRTQPRADAVILLADTCVLGPSKDAHIVCPRWESDVILFASGGDWHLRSDEALIVDGKAAGQRTKLPEACRIEGESFAMSLERIKI
ncbi:MAG: FHA domain-containing protein [Pirellulaceae bacterium]